MSTQKQYTVTEKAGDFVAGQRSPGAGKTIELTHEQAEHPLILGDIVDPTQAKLAEPATTPATTQVKPPKPAKD